MKGETRSPAMVIILSIITCGIYEFVWIYSVGNEIQNNLGNRDNISPGMDVVLSILCFPYLIYALYKYSEAIKELQQRNGVSVDDNSIMAILLSVFGFSFVAIAVLQNSLNKVWNESVF